MSVRRWSTRTYSIVVAEEFEARWTDVDLRDFGSSECRRVRGWSADIVALVERVMGERPGGRAKPVSPDSARVRCGPAVGISTNPLPNPRRGGPSWLRLTPFTQIPRPALKVI
jgi:hypothetical protein